MHMLYMHMGGQGGQAQGHLGDTLPDVASSAPTTRRNTPRCLHAKWFKRQKRFSVKAENRGVVVTEAGSY